MHEYLMHALLALFSVQAHKFKLKA